MEVHQLATSLSYGDAISDEIMEIQKILRNYGYRSEIFVKYFDSKMASYVRDYREYLQFSSPQNVVIFHFSIGSPVSKLISSLPDKKIMIYHNITPYHYFIDYHRILAHECYKGRQEIKLFADKVDLALGDSEFNRQELERAGYPQTGILPLILNFSKFDREGDLVTRDIFANNKMTLLYVGRLIPNKKFENVIKTFYFYHRYFNSNSQLILVGDYRGMERYYACLQDLICKLNLSDVHFSGHVEFSQLVEFYRLSHLYLSFSEHEGFGVPLLEAFYLQLPVIALAAGAVEETMNGGGVLLYHKDFIKTAALIDIILSDARMKKRIIEGQLKALIKYDKERTAKILLDYIERVSHR